jgi:hypothetical protein
MKLSIIIPCYNELNSIEKILETTKMVATEVTKGTAKWYGSYLAGQIIGRAF